MNQQREVIYSLRASRSRAGEELKGEALKMVEKALDARVETVLAEYETARSGISTCCGRSCSCTTCSSSTRWRTRIAARPN